MTACSDIIERRAIDVSGGLGSFYDASRDRVVHRSGAIMGFENQEFESDYDYKVVESDQCNGVIDLLKQLKFDGDLLQSILLSTVRLSGVSSLIDYNPPFNENTIFIYCSYKNREQNLDTKYRQVGEIVSLPSNLDNATHMITKIIWGFEILCVIQSPTNESAKQIEQLLYNINGKLQCCDKPLERTEEEKHQLNELSNVTIFGSKPYFDNSNASLLTILNELRAWQQHRIYHYPIVYILHPLNRIYERYRFHELYLLSEQDNVYTAQIEPTIAYLHEHFNHLKLMYENLPQKFSGYKVNERTNDISEKFSILLSLYQQFKTELQTILVRVRQGTCQSIEINNVMKDKLLLIVKETTNRRIQ